jgi:peptidoglycan/xylan/chitin deacetylase (PgdA/CDA1 family)
MDHAAGITLGGKSAYNCASVLTYHRIVDKSVLKKAFHDVGNSQFEEQMAVLARRRAQTEGPLNRLVDGPPVLLTFDDGTADHGMAGSHLHENGLVGTFFVITGRLGKEGRLSASDVKRLVAQGHRIGSHTTSHRQLPSLTTPEIFKELRTSRSVLEDLTGRTVDWLAPPGGRLCARSLAIACEMGFTVIRTMDWGYASLPLVGAVPCLPVLPHYSLRGFERLLDGHAMLWPFRLKRHLKRALGEPFYVACRNRFVRLGTGRV